MLYPHHDLATLQLPTFNLTQMLFSELLTGLQLAPTATYAGFVLNILTM